MGFLPLLRQHLNDFTKAHSHALKLIGVRAPTDQQATIILDECLDHIIYRRISGNTVVSFLAENTGLIHTNKTVTLKSPRVAILCKLLCVANYSTFHNYI